MVSSRTENPCVGGSIPPLATSITKGLRISQFLKNPFVCIFVCIQNQIIHTTSWIWLHQSQEFPLHKDTKITL